MDKRPLAVISVLFIIGIVLGRFLPGSITLFHVFVVTLIFILLCLILVLTHRRGGLNLPYGVDVSGSKGNVAHTFLFLSIISLGSLLYLNSNIFPPNHISYFLGKDKVKAEMIGTIKGPTEARGVYYGKVSSRYVFELESLDGLKVSGLAILRVQTEKDYQYGDRLMVKGTIKRPDVRRLKPAATKNKAAETFTPYQNLLIKRFGTGFRLRKKDTSGFNYKRYLENQNIFAIINAAEKNVTLLGSDYKVNPVIKIAYTVREKIKNVFLEKMPFESGVFLRAILLGDRSELPKKLNESFRNSGTMHILAISGLNVALLAGAFLYLFKFLRIKREICYALTMLFLLFLMLLTGSSASVVRATVMCIVFLTGLLLGRSVDPYNSLGAAGLFILTINPKDIFDIGFQLSFIAVLSMVYFTPRLMKLVKKDWNFHVRKYLIEPFMVSVSATLGTFPFILFYFRMGTPIAVISNIFIVPLMFILMIGGMCFIALGWVPFAGAFLAQFNNALANLIFFLAAFFANVKFGHFNV